MKNSRFTLFFEERKLLVVIILLLSISLNAQKNYNIWYFGLYSGLDFNQNPVKSFVDSSFSTFESSTSICDASGKLLFYTNGNYVINRHGDTMKNGKMKSRHYSASQGSMALKVPNSSNLYMLLLGAESESRGFGKVDSLSYAVIDMNGDNGNGEVIQKEIGILPRALENFAVALHANGIDYWIGAIEKKMKSFNLRRTQNGLSFSNIIRQTSEDGDSNYSNFSKFSPDSRKLAIMYTEATTSSTKNRFVDLYKFDNATGLLNVKLTLNIGMAAGMPHLEFSPNSKYLYVKQYENRKLTLLQYDLSVWDSASIIQSSKSFGELYNSIEGMQIGPDGRMYIFPSGYYTGNKELNFLSYPDKKFPDCQSPNKSINLGKSSNCLGFCYYPGFAFQKPIVELEKELKFCECDSMVLHAKVSDADSFKWRSSALNQSNLTIYNPGVYYFYTFLRGKQFTDSVVVVFQNMKQFDVVRQTELCQIPTILSYNGDGQVSWSTGETANAISRFDTGTVVLTISDDGCVYRYPINVTTCDSLVCFVPNAFTPNDNLLNEQIKPVCNKTNAVNFSVYNTWGEQVFKSNDLLAYWDGTFRGGPCPNGVYVLILEISGMSGNKPKTIYIKKTLHLLR